MIQLASEAVHPVSINQTDRFIADVCSYISDRAEILLIHEIAAAAKNVDLLFVLAHMMRADVTTLAVGADCLSISSRLPGVVNLAKAVNSLHTIEKQWHKLISLNMPTGDQAHLIGELLLLTPGDQRAVLIRMAELLVALRRNPVAFIPALEAQIIYAPLAGRLGLYQVESELQDEAFRVLDPVNYEWTLGRIALDEAQQEAYVERVRSLLKAELATAHIVGEVSGRVKRPYSYYQKLLTLSGAKSGDELRALDLQQVNDTIAFRILVGEKPDCYRALNMVHQLWEPMLKRIKDFIARPKLNGYQSIHTTVVCLDGRLVEIQIRTHAMHEYAEYGPAMHWQYKRYGDKAAAAVKDEGALVMLESKKKFVESIFALTPKGDVRQLPRGATPLDLAYSIHGAIGNHCTGALILSLADTYAQRRMVALDYRLHDGDIVQILINRSAHPSQSWLGFVQTRRARESIQHVLNREHALATPALELPARANDQEPVAEKVVCAVETEEIQESLGVVHVAGEGGLQYGFAKCCKPKTGDPIVGFVTRVKGLIIHRRHCGNITRMREVGRKRLVSAEWLGR